MLNRISESCMFDTYFGLQKIVSVELLSNSISSFIFAACMNEQCNHAQPITRSSFLLWKTASARAFIFINIEMYMLLSLVYCPLIFWNILLIYSVRIFGPWFCTTVTPHFHLRKQKWSGFLSFFSLRVIVRFLMPMILFLLFIYAKVLVA